MDTSNYLFTIDWDQILQFSLQLGVAFLLVLPIAWERERSTRIMGLRTFPLVSVSSCGYVLIASVVLADSPESKARLIQGLMTGIGFIGGGAILKEGGSVRGTATAASIWTTGVIGATVALGRYEIAIIISILNFLTLLLLTPVEELISGKRQTEANEEADNQ